MPRRTLGEIVNFYYNWKKSERHNIWRENQQKRREFHQHVDVKCVDLMGQIAESILRQNQIKEEKEKDEETKNGGNMSIKLATTCSTSGTSKISNSPTSSG